MRAVKQGDGKLIEYEVFDGRVRESQLCDLKDNPDELLVQHHDATVVALTGRKPAPFQINLAGDPRHTAKLTEMRALLLAEMRRHDDPFRLWNQPHDNLPTPPEPSAPAPKSGKAKKIVRAGRFTARRREMHLHLPPNRRCLSVTNTLRLS